MTLYIYAYRDCKLGCFEKPIYSTEDKEHIKVGVIRSCILAEESKKKMLADQALYYLGTFDDETCKFNTLEFEEKLLDLRDYIKFEVQDDGKEK